MNTTFNPNEVPHENFERLLKALKDCPKTAKELEEKTIKEEEFKKQTSVR
jgi:hypothetical protein